MIQVTITCDSIAELANYLRLENAPVAASTAKKSVQKTVAAEAVIGAAMNDASPSSAEQKTAEVEQKITEEQVRAAVKTKTAAGKREECKALLNEFGSENVTKLKPEHYSEFLNRLNQL